MHNRQNTKVSVLTGEEVADLLDLTVEYVWGIQEK